MSLYPTPLINSFQSQLAKYNQEIYAVQQNIQMNERANKYKSRSDQGILLKIQIKQHIQDLAKLMNLKRQLEFEVERYLYNQSKRHFMLMHQVIKQLGAPRIKGTNLELCATEICPICYDAPCNIQTNCNHTYCEPCIKKYLQKLYECPYCRAKITNLTLYGVEPFAERSYYLI
jgi:hypothetical protein